jgi:hypothetical protein
MEALSQLDIKNPDHISVITRDSRVTISVVKDGTSVTLGFPIKNAVFDTTPRPPLQQPAPQQMSARDFQLVDKFQKEAALAWLEKTAAEDSGYSLEAIKRKPKRNFRTWDGPSKLNAQSVKEIRMVLADADLRKSCGSVTNFYNVIGRKFGVSGCTISNIARGLAWKDVK